MKKKVEIEISPALLDEATQAILRENRTLKKKLESKESEMRKLKKFIDERTIKDQEKLRVVENLLNALEEAREVIYKPDVDFTEEYSI